MSIYFTQAINTLIYQPLATCFLSSNVRLWMTSQPSGQPLWLDPTLENKLSLTMLEFTIMIPLSWLKRNCFSHFFFAMDKSPRCNRPEYEYLQ